MPQIEHLFLLKYLVYRHHRVQGARPSKQIQRAQAQVPEVQYMQYDTMILGDGRTWKMYQHSHLFFQAYLVPPALTYLMQYVFRSYMSFFCR